MHYLPGARGVAGFLLFGLLAGCGGGGGGDNDAPVQISTNAITFSAAGPSAETPAAQVFTATFGKDVVQLSVVHSGDAIASATSVVNGRSAQITVVPTTPATVGPGAFVGAVAVTGYTCADTTCSRMAAGSTATISVNYQVSPAILSVAPYLGTAGVSDTVLIRGQGLRAFNISGVRFGDTAATTFTVNATGTELVATYPALAAGSYTVHLDSTNHTGAIPSNVALKVVAPVAYAATTLNHPAGTAALRSMVFDYERQALITVTDAGGGSLTRYQYANGAWTPSAPATNEFVDAALSADGTRLFAINQYGLIPVDPVTLAAGTSVAAPSLASNSFLKNIVVGYDNRSFITTSLRTSGSTQGYIFDPATGTIGGNGIGLNNGTPTMAANGAVAIVSQGDPTLTSDVPVYVYTTATNSLNVGAVSLRQNGIPPAVNRSVTRVVLNGTRVYDSNFALLGTLPASTAAVVLKSDGTRAYTTDTTSGGILVYDISVDRDEGPYGALADVIPLAADPGESPRMAISPDNGTLFIAGAKRIVVLPTPAL